MRIPRKLKKKLLNKGCPWLAFNINEDVYTRFTFKYKNFEGKFIIDNAYYKGDLITKKVDKNDWRFRVVKNKRTELKAPKLMYLLPLNHSISKRIIKKIDCFDPTL